MTNDLKLRKRLTLPEFHIPRTYSFTCLNPLKDITPFKEGITIDGDVKCLPAIVEMTSEYEGSCSKISRKAVNLLLPSTHK